MATSIVKLEVPGATDLAVSEDTLTAELADGRTISVPLACTRGWPTPRPRSAAGGNCMPLANTSTGPTSTRT